MARQAQRRIADQHTKQRRQNTAGERARKHRPAPIRPQQRARVATDPKKGNLREGKQTRVAVDEVEARAQDGEQRHGDAELQTVGAAGPQRERPGEDNRAADRGAAHSRAHRRTPRPNSPSGLRRRSRIMATKAIESTSAGARHAPTMLSSRPSSTAAISDPGMLPRPPMMTMANALKTKLTPMV